MVLSKEEAKRLSIISVAEQLGMELKRTGSHSYNWVEHDSFVIDTKKNEFYWNSRTEFGDVIQLVQTIRGVSYKEAMHFLETGEFKAVDVEAQTATKEPFSYHLERYERQDFSASRSYLKAQRGLSDDTINFFISQGSIAEAIRKKGDYFEPVIVFKYKDNTGFLAGASLQGIVENREHYPERGRLKQIMRNSDGQLGFSIDIGTPKRLIFAEAPIDLMSYYELHKDSLQDVRLVAMDGVKDGIISRRFMELYAEINDKSYQINQNTGKALELVVRTTNYFKDGQHQDMITLAVDNDMAGHKFITSLQEKGIPVQIAIPPILHRDQEKEDWNDFLKRENEAPKELAHVYIADEKSWNYQGFFEKELALAKAQELTTQDVKAFVSDVQLTKEEVHQKYQTIIHQERGRENTMSESYDNGTKYEAEDVPSSSKKDDGFVIQPETQDIIDSGEVKQWAEHPNIYFVKGLRRVALELTEEGKFEQTSQYLPNTKEEKEVVNKLLSKQKKQDDQSSELNIDTSNLSSEDAEWLRQNWHNISFSVEPKKQMVIDGDKTVIYEKPSDPIGYSSRTLEENQSIEKALEKPQEQIKKTENEFGDFSEIYQKAAPLPEAKQSQPLDGSSPNQTQSQSLLHFTILDADKSIYKPNYHPIKANELRKLNRYAPQLQQTANWYLNTLADSKVYYFFKDEEDIKVVSVSFYKENFMHLTGIAPIKDDQTPEQTLLDFVEGRGEFDNIMIANRGAAFEKLQVLPDFEAIIDAGSFYFDDLSQIEKFNRIDLSQAIMSEDKDLLLALRDIDGIGVPASLMKVKETLSYELEGKEKIILGVFRDRDGRIEQLSINEDYIKNDGKELQSIMENGLFEAIQPNEIDKNTYNVRLQWAEKHDGGPILPFSEAELVDYQSFAKELYKQNNIYYDKHHASVSNRMNQVEGASYTPFTKVQFVLYSPDGELIQDGIRYDIGDEINPIAHKERLGTREMREHPELMKIDGALFNQYHLERLASELDISQFSYALEDALYADQLLSQLPFGDLENSPIGFTDSSHDSRLGFISFDGMDSVEVENLSAWFEKLGVKDSPMEQVVLVEKWQKEVNDLSEKVEQTIANVREEFEKLQVKDSQNTPDNPYEKIYQYNRKDERDRDLDGDGISNSDEMLQGTDPYNSASNLHKKQEDRERRTDVEVATGTIITDAIAAKSSEQTISQLVANKDTKALAEHLKEGMRNYLDSEQFKSFLDTMSKFHNYSLNNIHLLKMQNPNVSQVASFNKWKTDFDRTVKKGSKALKIWVPYQVKTKISANQNELSFSPSENEMEEKEVTVTRFKLGNVFDISQTEGKELPKAINELTGDVKDYENLYRAAKAVSMDNQVSISFEEIKRESTNGYYSPDENRIVISKGLKGQEQILKTIFHEMAHADLHRGTNAQYGDDQYRKQELQAESVAYVVANHFGFDTSSYSFGYLAIWAKDKNGFEDMVEQLQVVQKEAKSLIDRMDAKLELVKNKTVTKDKFADKLQQAKEKSEQLGNQKAEAVKQVEEKKSLSSPR
ncbi:putative conjugative transposon membrane protein [Streptococcus pneumoniae]|nr:PBECR4 domain-containing protein [Streptococcus pneumoniae]MDG7389842.1 PBECR4 domain-containing protein [Streptococcus pneumoniae]VOS20784.1 putative conjugative transposon membrane protein [Streptococcus pneumoniae]VOT44693.1 putative conjugative transposon membrane protein [Streptococcus pneumoniae]VOT63061.1 putative conjugative transposon membrane protein [Streptococcus pneumoniae]